jgi:hypothetical protein
MAFQPMPLTRKLAPFDDPEWVFELKYDGFRSLAVIHGGRAELVSRNGNSFKSFEALRKQLRSPNRGKTVLDGEIVCVDRRGRPQFEDLLFHRGEARFFAFDLLMVDGRDLRTEKLTDRKQELRRLMSEAPTSRMQYVDHIRGHGTALFERVCNLDLEGSWPNTASGHTSPRASGLHGSRSRIVATHRWQAARNCLTANATKNLSLAGIPVNWPARRLNERQAALDGIMSAGVSRTRPQKANETCRGNHPPS